MVRIHPPQFSAKIVADSIYNGRRLTTFQLSIPTVLLAELNTHRQLSRSASSFRAIPVNRMLQRCKFVPMHWGKSQPGMQANDRFPTKSWQAALGRLVWWLSLQMAMAMVKVLVWAGIHKQVANRLLTPFTVTDVVVTATDWSNFFGLRCHPDTEPHFRALAWNMADLYYFSKPLALKLGDWHLPFVTEDEKKTLSHQDLLHSSAARCARVSYLNHEGAVDIKKDRDLFNRLVMSGHWSPMEHVATPDFGKVANLNGWRSLRHHYSTEQRKFNYHRSRMWRYVAREIYDDAG